MPEVYVPTGKDTLVGRSRIVEFVQAAASLIYRRLDCVALRLGTAHHLYAHSHHERKRCRAVGPQVFMRQLNSLLNTYGSTARHRWLGTVGWAPLAGTVGTHEQSC